MDDTPWLRDVLRFALHASSATEIPWFDNDIVQTTAGRGELVDPDDPGKDPRFRKMVEAILFSRRFLKTYNLVLLGILLVFTIWHWGGRLVLHRRKRRIDTTTAVTANTREGDPEAWSSSSSTLSGTASPPQPKKLDETSPLLLASPPRTPFSPLWKPYYLLKGTLHYQPPPVPFFNKTLPSNAVSLLVLAWLALILFYNLYRMPLSFFYLFVFADRCGIIFISNLPLLYLLAAKNQPLKFLTGNSYESLNVLHRRVGEVMCVEALLHLLGMFAVWYGLLRHLGFTLARFIINRVVLLGLAAFIAYEVIYFTSLGSFRKRWYELFLGLHIVLQVAGLAFLWFHHYTSRPYVGVSLAIFLVDRVVYRLWLRSSSHPATLTVLEDDETILLSADWDVQASSALRRDMKHGWLPNQHIFLSIPALSRLQSHPFTIFSAAPTSTTSQEETRGKHAWLSLLIRPQSTAGMTHSLLQHARTHPSTRIRLDGPYGSSHALDMLQASNTAVIVAGGSGIAVAYPLLYALLSPSSTASDLEATSPGQKRKVKLLWITHSPRHRLWVPIDKMKELEEWGLDVLMPPPTEFAGRPDVRDVLQEWTRDEKDGRTGVIVSGPDGLVREVRNVCAGMMVSGRDLSVSVEKFGW
ncbi:ferric reductase transmembrane component [Phaeosphaeria sp. MPI-PUGE-AT-0046c]|nr:ferric reductase transmembrane component [Phaeosphaeria sp. MPI-PUGE-AT-0046c]